MLRAKGVDGRMGIVPIYLSPNYSGWLGFFSSSGVSDSMCNLIKRYTLGAIVSKTIFINVSFVTLYMLRLPNPGPLKHERLTVPSHSEQ